MQGLVPGGVLVGDKVAKEYHIEDIENSIKSCPDVSPQVELNVISNSDHIRQQNETHSPDNAAGEPFVVHDELDDSDSHRREALNDGQDREADVSEGPGVCENIQSKHETWPQELAQERAFDRPFPRLEAVIRAQKRCADDALDGEESPWVVKLLLGENCLVRQCQRGTAGRVAKTRNDGREVAIFKRGSQLLPERTHVGRRRCARASGGAWARVRRSTRLRAPGIRRVAWSTGESMKRGE